MKKPLLFCFILSALLNSALGDATPWQQQVDEQVNRLGHRNRIVIADSAFPIQTGEGVQVIVTGADHMEVVAYALKAIEKCPAVRPIIALDKEFAYVPEAYAPGAAALRAEILALLAGKSSMPISETLHEELLAEINRIAADYTVVVFKTTGVIPYSSVFFTLDCGYWSEEGEQAMRRKMAGEG